jgi:hypothetical protein
VTGEQREELAGQQVVDTVGLMSPRGSRPAGPEWAGWTPRGNPAVWLLLWSLHGGCLVAPLRTRSQLSGFLPSMERPLQLLAQMVQKALALRAESSGFESSTICSQWRV